MDILENWDDEPEHTTLEQNQVLETTDTKDKDTHSITNKTGDDTDNDGADSDADSDAEDKLDKCDFIPPILPDITSEYVIPKLQSKAEIQRLEQSQTQGIPKLPPTIQEVEVKYPNGIIPKKEAVLKQFGRVYTNEDIERIKKFQLINPVGNIINDEYIGKIKPQVNIQGERKNILKTELINKIIDSLDSLIKNNAYIKLSQNWSKSVFQNEILANIKKKNIFKWDGYSFSIKKTLETLNTISTYLNQRHISNKISIITKNKKGSKIDDLVFTLYKSIIFNLHQQHQQPLIRSRIYFDDIFEFLAFIKLLKQNDDITINYISENY
jgi:hypothetical protein